MELILTDVHLPMRHAFTIALGTTTVQHNLLVELRQDGVTGYGEGASSHAYHEFTAASMRAALEAARPQIEGARLDDPAQFWDQILPVLGHNRFALCALDEAAHDLWGKQRGAPVWKLLGLELKNLPLSDYTIGIDPVEKMVMKMKEFEGWPIYKIKLGTEDDLAIVRELRRHTDAVFRIDANTAWTADQTIAYAPELQNPQFGPGMTIVARSSIPTANAMSSVRRAVLQSWPAVRIDELEFRVMVNDRLLRERLLAWVSGFFGILAFALATLGLYGVISHIVASRRNEVGIRIALGANRGEVIGLFLRQVALLLTAGIAIGTLGSLLLSRGATTLLFDIQPNDPWTIAVAAGVLAAAGIAAALVPSARASRLDPANCLRTD